MTQICTCSHPRIVRKAEGSYCDKCGHWWNPKYGSVRPSSAARKAIKRAYEGFFLVSRRFKRSYKRNFGYPLIGAKEIARHRDRLARGVQYGPRKLALLKARGLDLTGSAQAVKS